MEILYLNQDMREFELYGTVDAVLCLMDSINYVTSERDVKKVFKLVKNYLNPDGIFIFDINSEYKLENVLGNNVFYDVDEEITYIWQNSYKKKTGLCEFDLTFFIKEGEYYRKYDEQHVERAYAIDELKVIAEEVGLEVLGVYDDLSLKKPDDESERIFFVCKNV
jgi:SAM-dependent methyltransferase